MPYGIGIAVVVVLLAAAGKVLLRRRRRARLMQTPLPDAWREIITKNVPLSRRLPQPLREQLYGLVQVFLAEKKFEGCGGLEITDEIRLTIAAQACTLLLNRKTRCFGKLKTVLVYPSTYVAKDETSGDRSVRLGESWQNGPVVLAWDSVTGGTGNVADARNVVLHEFAHQLDQENGVADGAPILSDGSRYVPWARVLGAEYEALQKKRNRRRSVVGKYGATHPAEFFAVATEAFFEKPRQMQKRHPELYEQLCTYYRLDPGQWS